MKDDSQCSNQLKQTDPLNAQRCKDYLKCICTYRTDSVICVKCLGLILILYFGFIINGFYETLVNRVRLEHASIRSVRCHK